MDVLSCGTLILSIPVCFQVYRTIWVSFHVHVHHLLSDLEICILSRSFKWRRHLRQVPLFGGILMARRIDAGAWTLARARHARGSVWDVSVEEPCLCAWDLQLLLNKKPFQTPVGGTSWFHCRVRKCHFLEAPSMPLHWWGPATDCSTKSPRNMQHWWRWRVLQTQNDLGRYLLVGWSIGHLRLWR